MLATLTDAGEEKTYEPEAIVGERLAKNCTELVRQEGEKLAFGMTTAKDRAASSTAALSKGKMGAKGANALQVASQQNPLKRKRERRLHTLAAVCSQSEAA